MRMPSDCHWMKATQFEHASPERDNRISASPSYGHIWLADWQQRTVLPPPISAKRKISWKIRTDYVRFYCWAYGKMSSAAKATATTAIYETLWFSLLTLWRLAIVAFFALHCFRSSYVGVFVRRWANGKNSQNNVALQNRQGNTIEGFIRPGQLDFVKYARLLAPMNADHRLRDFWYFAWTITYVIWLCMLDCCIIYVTYQEDIE